MILKKNVHLSWMGLAIALVVAGCAAVALAPVDREGSLEIALGGGPEWLVNPEGFMGEDDKAVLNEIQKTVVKLKFDPTEVFLKAFADEVRKAGVFKAVVTSGGARVMRFSNLRPLYTDGELTQSLPIHAEGWLGIQVVTKDGRGAWASMISTGAEGALKVKLEDLIGKPDQLNAFFADFGKRMGQAAAKKMLAQ